MQSIPALWNCIQTSWQKNSLVCLFVVQIDNEYWQVECVPNIYLKTFLFLEIHQIYVHESVNQWCYQLKYWIIIRVNLLTSGVIWNYLAYANCVPRFHCVGIWFSSSYFTYIWLLFPSVYIYVLVKENIYPGKSYNTRYRTCMYSQLFGFPAGNSVSSHTFICYNVPSYFAYVHEVWLRHNHSLL